jgi:hypothetical protein
MSIFHVIDQIKYLIYPFSKRCLYIEKIKLKVNKKRDFSALFRGKKYQYKHQENYLHFPMGFTSNSHCCCCLYDASGKFVVIKNHH